MRAFGFCVAMVLAASSAGCADPVPSELKACPCAAGYLCCDTGVCAEDARACGDTSAALFGLVKGQWTGYFENFRFRSGSDALVLSLGMSADGVPSAEVVLGAAAPSREPLRSDEFWPPEASTAEFASTLMPALEGARYTAQDLRWETHRLRFTIDRYEPWEPFCALQPVFRVADGYQCVPERVGAELDGTCTLVDSGAKIDCRRALLCDAGPGAACECTSVGCHAASAVSMSFDLTLSPEMGDGTARIGDTPFNVRLRR